MRLPTQPKKSFLTVRDGLSAALWYGAGMVLLLAPALWNGFPLLYPDSIDYLTLPFTLKMPEWRTAPYGLFAGIGRIAATPWAILVLQCALILLALRQSANAWGVVNQTERWGLLLVAVLGGVPLYASQIMADAFAGAVILIITTLLLRGNTLAIRQKIILGALAAVMIAAHTSHIALASGLLLLAGLAMVLRRFQPMLPSFSLLPAATSLAAAIALTLISNAAVTGRLAITQVATVQMLGLYVENGMARRYLDAVCPSADPPPYRLCAWRDRLPETANMFLWGQDSPRDALGGWDGLRPDADGIVAGATRAYPLHLLRESARLAAWQFVWLTPGDGITPMQSFMRQPIATYYPAYEADFMAAEQQQRVLDFDDLALPTQIVASLALIVLLVGGVIAWRRGRYREAAFAVLVCAALVGNAIVGGALSNPNKRYQGRIIWAEAVAALILVRALSKQGRDESSGARGRPV